MAKRVVRRVALISGLVLGACTSTSGRWEGGPDQDSDAVAVAQADCQSIARLEAERSLPPREMGGSVPSSTQPYDRGGVWDNMMNRFSAQTREQGVFERCMTQRGFRFVPNTP